MGLIQAANEGTLFLDEIGDMSMQLQAKLLRVLEAREVTPIGSNKAIPVDIRVISATNRDFAELIARGSIHVYGRLRGRAMAGAEGDEEARIFCNSLDAELLAVAGLYRTSENLEPELLNRPVQVFLQDGRLCVETLG